MINIRSYVYAPILGSKAIEEQKILTSAINIRNYAEDRHQVTDDRPYGGGSGMVMKPEPLAQGHPGRLPDGDVRRPERGR